MMATDSATYEQHLERIIQFAAKTETTPQLQSYWYNKYSELSKQGLFTLNESTIEHTIQADTVIKPITPAASISLLKHIDKDIHGVLQTDLNEAKFQATLEVVVRLLDSILDSINFSTDSQFLVSEYRKVGISISDFAEYINHKGGGVNPEFETDFIGSLISNGVYRASESLAEEKGVCQGWESINKVIKDKTFEYWFNIDTGEIKSGGEIAEEFDAQSILDSKFEIVPRRNSHLLLFTGGLEWAKWTDREKLLQPEDSVTVDSMQKVQEASKGLGEVKSPVDDTPLQDTPSVEKEEIQDQQLETNPEFTSQLGELDEVLFQSHEVGSIDQNTTPEQPQSIDSELQEVDSNKGFAEAKPDPDMIDLDDLMKNFDDADTTPTPLFEPIDTLDEVKTDIIAEKIGVTDEVIADNTEAESISKLNTESQSDDKKSSRFGFIKNLNPFAQKSEQNSEGGVSLTQETSNDIQHNQVDHKTESTYTEHMPQEAAMSVEESIETSDGNTDTNVVAEPEAENEYSVGELVKIIDTNHAQAGKYLQVVGIEQEGNTYFLLLLDGTLKESETCVALPQQVEPASIDQVLAQLNVQSHTHSEAETVVKDVADIQTHAIPDTVIMLVNARQQVLLSDDGVKKALPIKHIDGEKDVELAISELLFTDYNITGVRDIAQVGFFTNPETKSLTLAYYGVIEGFSSIPEGYGMFDISDIYSESADTKAILDLMSQSEKNAIESLHEREQQIHNLQQQIEQLTTQSMTTTTSSQDTISQTPLTQANTGSIDNAFTANVDESQGSITQEVMKDIEKEQSSHTPQPTQIPTNKPMTTQTVTEQTGQGAGSVTYFPEGTVSPSSSVYQSTSKVASYSKFSVVLNQIISTAEFGNIVLHVHYDSQGPRVLTVELPQLINDSMLQVLRTYLNLINASLIRGTHHDAVVSLIQDQLELAGESGPIVTLIGIIINAVNALPKSVQEVTNMRLLTLDKKTSTDVVKSGTDPLKALVAKYAVN